MLKAAILAAMSNATNTFAQAETASNIGEVSEAMFSMESMFSTDPVTAVTKFKATADNITRKGEDVIDQIGAMLHSEGYVESEDPIEAKLAVARVLFGEAMVNKAVKEGNTENILTMLGSAGDEMATTMFALKADGGVDKLTNTAYESGGFSMESMSGYDYEGFSMEHFDKFDPEAHTSVSMLLSAMSVIESPVVRINYPAYKLQPSQNVIELTLSQEFLIGNDVRGGKGQAFTKEDTPLLDSYFRSDLWSDNRLECIPVYEEASKSFFVDKALTGTASLKDELGKDFKRGFLAFGKEVDLISIAGSRGEIKNRAQDRTDQLDPAFSLRSLVVKVHEDGAPSTAQAFTVPVGHFDSAESFKETQGGSREFSITFSEKNIRSKSPRDMTDIENVPALLQPIIDAYPGGLAFSAQATFSRIDLTSATVNPMGSIVVTGAYTADNKFVPADDATLAPLLAAVGFTASGYDLDIQRTDTNFSNNGKEVEVSSTTKRYKVGFSPRIQVRNPVGTSSVEEARLLDSSLRKITREKVINKLKDKFELLLEYTEGKGAIAEGVSYPSRAFGDIVTLPTLRFEKYTPSADTVTRRHAERIADARGHVIGLLRTLITEATNESRLKTVAKDLNKGVEDIKVNITVDPRINQLLMVEGDDNLLTTAFKNFEIIEDEADVFKNHIFVTFSVDTPYEISPISNGIRAVGVSPVVRFDPEQNNGVKIAKTFAQPRELILDTNNIMVVVEVENLDDLMTVSKA